VLIGCDDETEPRRRRFDGNPHNVGRFCAAAVRALFRRVFKNILKHPRAPQNFFTFYFIAAAAAAAPFVCKPPHLTPQNRFSVACHPLRYGIDVEFTKSALERVASLASGQGTGARGLLTVLDDVLRDFKFELPGRQLPSNSLNTKQTAAAASSAAKSANAADLVDTLLTGAFESNTASTNDGKNNSGEDSAVREGSEGNFRLLVGAEVVDDPEGALKTLLAELDQVSLQSSGQANSYKDT